MKQKWYPYYRHSFTLYLKRYSFGIVLKKVSHPELFCKGLVIRNRSARFRLSVKDTYCSSSTCKLFYKRKKKKKKKKKNAHKK